MALIAALIGLVVGVADSSGSQTQEELQAAARHLLAVESTLEPLPDTGITRDAGQIAIIEHDGSPYDARLEGGTLNYEARTRVGRRFYETHADDYDFLVVFTNFEFDTGPATAFHLLGRNDVEGIGKPIGSAAPEIFGSTARLKGWIDMAAVARRRLAPFSVTPGELGFLETLDVLAHELAHQWLAEARFLDSGHISDDLLGADDNHWSYLLDSDGSLMYGADWVDGGEGLFTAARVKAQYSALDRYLMGFLAASEVPPITLLRNPAVDRHRINQEGETVTAIPETLSIDQLVAAMGPRQPSARHSQKEFRAGFIFLTAPGTEPSAADLEAVERIRRAFGAHFFALTQGVGWCDTTLAPVATPPSAALPDLGRALGWLLARQGLDGSWADSPRTSVRDTTAAVRALGRAGATGTDWQQGLLWLRQADSESLDFRSRRDATLAALGDFGPEAAGPIAALVARQNADGGFGAGIDFASDALDTALALRALRALGHPADARIRSAVSALEGLAGPDGGWAAIPGGPASTVVTAEVLLALQDWSELPEVSAPQASGLSALLARRNPDGGFGASPSTPFASALALEVLLRAESPPDVIEPLVSWLQQRQLADGSWAGSPFQTALVLGALSESLGANLVVPADTLTLTPNPATEGEVVSVRARVRNTGRTEAPASVARLFDGSPDSSPSLAEAVVPPLAPGQEADVAFDFQTADRPGPRSLYVLADAAEQVSESREDDNATSRLVTVVGLLADLVVTSSDIGVDPAAPEVGETATVTVSVTNRGERASPESQLRLSVIHLFEGTSVLPDAPIPPLGSGETVAVPVPWTPTAIGEQVLRATADAHYAVPESNETNGSAERVVEVLAAAPAGVELSIRDLSLVPATLQELPQVVEIRAVVENAGRTPATALVTVFDDDSGESLGTLSVDLGAREAVLATLSATIRTPGTRLLEAVVDPDDLIPEQDERNNERDVVLSDDQTLDVEITSASLSSADVELGETVSVTVEVTNRGTRGLAGVPIQLALHSDEGPSELTRTTVSLAAGDTETLTLWWSAALEGDALPLKVRADPFDLLPERREDNNEKALVLRVRPTSGPNLAVSGAEIVIAPDPPVEGDSATLTAVVRNTGGTSTGPFRVAFFVGDPDEGGTSIGEASLADLAPGAEGLAEVSWAPVTNRGSLGLFVLADSDGDVDEADESDNVAFRPFNALGLPNLVLTAGDVSLDPNYPRQDEPVTLTATVRNLGDQASVPTSLEVTEGEPSATAVATLPVPALAPGGFETLTLSWTPAAPAGARALRLTVDDGEQVAEQDEGDNSVRRVVVVQDGDLYLSAPFFSPDGDDILDETTLAWRATGTTGVVVSDSKGQPVRTLVTGGPASGSATWDGRDDLGALLWDGRYSVSLVGEGDRLLATAAVTLDTNRSPIHEATGPDGTFARNVTCSLPDSGVTAVWAAAEDALFATVRFPSEAFPAGLLRMELDGDISYVSHDSWFTSATIAGPGAASPDGRTLLFNGGGDAFDLLTGERESLGTTGLSVAWSPDGRFVVVGDEVISRDGSPVGDLGAHGAGGNASWAWAPSSDRLAQGGTVVSRDGELLVEVPLADEPFEDGPRWTAWRGDGRIATGYFTCGDEEEFAQVSSSVPVDRCEEWFVIDLEAGTSERLDWSTDRTPAWSPDGTRAAVGAEIRGEDGVLLGTLPAFVQVAPRSSAGLYTSSPGTGQPGTVCGGRSSDQFVLSTLANLTAQLDVARLPGNAGVVLRGVATDRHLERFELDYARANDPETWHPIGAASDVPVADDTFTVWVPPGPGTYVVRLRVSDRAGHQRVRTRTVAWDELPALTNFTQSGYYISPDGNGVKDEVEFRYLVIEPTRLDVRVVGPEPLTDDAPAAGEVLRRVFEHSVPGSQSFIWVGTDDGNRVVPDGRYTVFLNDLPFRVEVDNTPPEIGLRFESLRVAGATIAGERRDSDCIPGDISRAPLGVRLPGSSVAVDRVWHVVDPLLESWSFHSSGREADAGDEQVFVVETDEFGGPVLEGGRPRVDRENGRPVDRRDGEWALGYSRATDMTLEAVDRAGNVSRIAVLPPEEAILPLMGVAKCEVLAKALEPGGVVNELRPEDVFLQAGPALHVDPQDQDLRLEFQPADGGAWREIPLPPGGGWHRTLEIESFEDLDIDPTGVYEGRFSGQGESGEVSSAPFLFTPCAQWLRSEMRFESGTGRPFVILRARLDEGVAWARARFTLEVGGSQTPLGVVDMVPLSAEAARRFGVSADPAREVVLSAPLPPLSFDCDRQLKVSVEVRDGAGERYPSTTIEGACQKLSFRVPSQSGCVFTLAFGQTFPGCGESPNLLLFHASGGGSSAAHITIEGGPPEAPTPIDAFDFVPTPESVGFSRDYEVPLLDHPDGVYPLRGRIAPLDPELGAGTTAELFAIVDRTPPAGAVLLPPEGGAVCVATGAADPFLQTLVRIDDASPWVSVDASWRPDGGIWQPLPRVCDRACEIDATVRPGVPFELAWNANGLDAGGVDLRIEYCDRSGNTGATVRRLQITREPPTLQVTTLQPYAFSPNSDGRSDETSVVVRLAQAGQLSARVHSGGATGPVVRTLFEDQPSTATDVPVVWDGRTDGGALVPDGPYAVVFSVADACGGAGDTSAQVQVDTVPPHVALAEPTGGQRVSAGVDVLGEVTDPLLALWELDLSCGTPAAWTSLESRTNAVSAGAFLAWWDTSLSPAGECQLRLVAEDDAGNRSPEVFATALVERGDLIERLAATPDVFSPNGDARRETSTLEYTLARGARVRLEILGPGGFVRVLESDELHDAGAQSHVWDGRDGGGALGPDGKYVLWMRAEDPLVPTVSEEETVSVTVDTEAPVLSVTRPLADAVIPAAESVRGSVEDATLVEYVVTAAPLGVLPIELGRGTRERREALLAPLGALAEGSHALRITASDRGENESQLDVPFVVDSTPPRAALQSPLGGAILLRGEVPIPVMGLVGDDHLAGWTLDFSTVADPASHTRLAHGTTEGNALALAAWDVRFVPDGDYILSLTATDLGGLSTESQLTVTLDGNPPDASLESPTEGGYVTEALSIVGSVTDAQLASWTLEAAPGNAASAYQWIPLGTGDENALSEPLAEWSPLPADGLYTLRLRATDQAGLASVHHVTVSVDTTPPATPTGLGFDVVPGEEEGRGLVRISWNPNTEPDLRGYPVVSERLDLDDLFEEPRLSEELLEGRYVLLISAVDEAGNQSAPAQLEVLVDLTPPSLSFLSPEEGAAVAGAIEIVGSAWSADDFGEYRLLVGVGADPSDWTLLQRSTLPVAGGRLGDWLALVEGPHVLALEAEDTRGNESRITRAVQVDTTPPEPPVLLRVDQDPPPVDRLTPVWQQSVSNDVEGYLVYRNGQVANAGGVVLGDLMALLVQGPSHDDDGLPDGEHCYNVVAMDEAGNVSSPSGEICRSLDNRAPQAVIVQPTDGARFGHPLRVLAETPDLDVATVRFERRPLGAPDWTGFGDRLAAPWEMTLDPQGLDTGEYEIRAVATDEGANTDPAPASITVIFGDTTPPSALLGLEAQVDGADVDLTWTPSAAADFLEYRLYRDGVRIAEGLVTADHLDADLAVETYAYTVTAVDADDNESPPSDQARAVVYAPSLATPFWPVVPAPLVTVTGDGSRVGTTVKVLAGPATLAEGPGTGGVFQIDGVPLAAGGTILYARGEDVAGNRSLPSNEIALIANAPPATVTGLTTSVDASDVTLQWSPVADTDLFGYVVRRDDTPITDTVLQDQATSFNASVDSPSAALAFDQNPATVWPSVPAAAEWRVVFPAPVLVESVHLRFASAAGLAPAQYTVLATWQGRDVPLVSVENNASLLVEHSLPAPFATDSLRVVLEEPGQIAEVEVHRLDVTPAGTELTLDEDVADGRHTYTVAAVDHYGSEGPPASAEAEVGDVEPPSAPTGLVATPDGRDAVLTWDPSPEPDVESYTVVRDGAPVGSSPSAGFRDADLPNGTYVYTVIAVDGAGNESDESASDDATIAVPPALPAPPVILEPTDAANPITRSTSTTDVAGRAEAGAIVSLDVDGEPRGATLALPGFEGVTPAFLPSSSARALSPDGRRAAFVSGPGTLSVRDRVSGLVELYADGGDQPSETLVFSPVGEEIAFTRRLFVSGQGYLPEVARLRLVDRSVVRLADGSPAGYAWSPDGSQLAVSLHESEGTSLHIVDVETLDRTDLLASPGTDTHLRFPPDGTRLAFVRTWSPTVAELRVLDLATGTLNVLDAQAWPGAPPSWSPEGLLAWTTADQALRRVRILDTATGEDTPGLSVSGAHTQDPRFSPSGQWLSVARVTPDPSAGDRLEIVARHRSQALPVSVHPFGPGVVPEVHEWTGDSLSLVYDSWVASYTPVDGRFVLLGVSLVPGENRLVARAEDPDSGLVSDDSATVLITVPDTAFANLIVEATDLTAVPPVPLVAGSAELRVRVTNLGPSLAEESSARVSVLDPQGRLTLDTVATVPRLFSDESIQVSLPWTPTSAGRHTVLVRVDPDSRVEETNEDDNSAERTLVVAAGEAIAAVIDSDRSTYLSGDTARVSVGVANPGPSFTGVARTVVEDEGGAEVVLLDERPVTLEYGQSLDWSLTWSTGTTWAGAYRFRVGVVAQGEETEEASAAQAFTLEPSLQLAVRARPEPALVPAGAPVSFALGVDNLSPNAPLEGAVLRLRVVAEVGGALLFEAVRPLPTLLPGATWEATEVWSAALPEGVHPVSVEAEAAGGEILAAASASLHVTAGSALLQGLLVVEPGDAMAGDVVDAQLSLTNGGTLGVVDYPISVDIVSGPDATVHASTPAVVDLPVGAHQDLSVALDTAGLAPATYVVLLRGGAPPTSLSRDGLRLHGPLAPPSPHAPADGGTVDTAHPALVVNNATSAGSATRTYEFELFGDAALTQALPGASGVGETVDRTSWRVAAGLAEDTTYWWRARASDGFSESPWSAVASFTVDALNLPPQAPVPDTPGPDARVASRQPALTVRNAVDPEGAALSYEFRLARSQDMSDVVTSTTGVAEGLGLTSWTVPVVLDENAVHHWTSRASDGVNLSPWTTAVRFRVDTINESPTPPRPLRPVDGVDVDMLSTALVVANSTDPEEDPVLYRFEIDTEPTFDSPQLQASATVPEGPGETGWTPPVSLVENTAYSWRAFAGDGHTETPSAVAGFFVNVANDPPSAPVALDPVDGRAVGTASPTLLLRNATDPEDDLLTYELLVRDARGDLVAESPPVPAGTDETAWTLPVSLAENGDFTWTARASDGDLFGPWSAPAAFRVNAVAEPPTAPVPVLPADGAVLDEASVTLVVENATSPDRLALVYAFELSLITFGGPVLVESVAGLPEGLDTTSWLPTGDLADGEYEWRARASDPGQDGAWSATSRFEVRVDPPPAAPLGLTATPGDGSVRLDWSPSPEPDVTGYRVYRGTTSGGPYDRVGSSATPMFDDTGLTNGITYSYVVTALDARSESLPSLEAAARPEAPQALVAEVRYEPSILSGECLLVCGQGHSGSDCPQWIDATLELPLGYDPASIDLASLRFLGVVPADPHYDALVDTDHDGLFERRVRFELQSVAPLLAVGENTVTVTGTAGAHDLQGTAQIHVAPLAPDLHMAPQTLNRRSKGNDVLAKLTFASGVPASEVEVSSVRLNDTVPVKRVVTVHENTIHLKFDRSEVIAVLPGGNSVEVRVTGTLRGLPFEGVDYVKVKN